MPQPRVSRKPFAVGDEVWLPVAEVRKTHDEFRPVHDGAVVRGRILDRIDGDHVAPGTPRSWNVEVPGSAGPIAVSSRRMRRYAKILIFRIGDWDTEHLTLNPLASSLRAQLSLLVPPEEVDVEYIRTLDELRDALSVHGGGGKPITVRQASPWGYAVFVGHGRAGASPGIQFGGTWKAPTEIAAAITGLGPGRRAFGDAVFVSLCCETGEDAFAAAFSRALKTTFLGPGQTVHSFEAAGYVQRLFFELFLSGNTFARAVERTHAATEDYSTRFRCWLNGEAAE